MTDSGGDSSTEASPASPQLVGDRTANFGVKPIESEWRRALRRIGIYMNRTFALMIATENIVTELTTAGYAVRGD